MKHKGFLLWSSMERLRKGVKGICICTHAISGDGASPLVPNMACDGYICVREIALGPRADT